MADSDSNASDEGRDIGDEIDRNEEVLPYMFEPETSEEESESDSDISGDDRLEGTEWCSCGHCAVMPTVRESRCCTEVERVQAVRDEEGVACITLHPGFDAVCLNPWVLQTAYYQYRQQYGGHAQEKSLHEKYRHTAYRQLVRLCWQFLGKEVRVVLPSCAVKKIRDAFPSERYEGFHLPGL